MEARYPLDPGVALLPYGHFKAVKMPEGRIVYHIISISPHRILKGGSVLRRRRTCTRCQSGYSTLAPIMHSPRLQSSEPTGVVGVLSSEEVWP